MRIDLHSGIRETGSAESCRAGTRAAHKEPGSKAGDAIEVAWNQAGVQSLTAAALRSPEVRQEKIAALAEKIVTGSYNVTAEQLAGAMVTQMASGN
jgi:flagellar biosynthesis anti-sigma factor FlgM